MPMRIRSIWFCGTVKSTSIGSSFCSVTTAAPGREVLAEVHLPDAELAGERRGDGLLRDQCLLRRHLRLRALERRHVVVDGRLRNGAHLELRFVALQVELGQRRLGFELRELRLERRRIELDQRLTRAHLLARVEMDGGDQAADFGAQRRFLARAKVAERFHRRLPARLLCDGGRHRLRRIGAALDGLGDHRVLELLEPHHAAHDDGGDDEHDDHA